MAERDYQSGLIERLYKRFGQYGCLVLKNDSSHIQGIPDLTLFVGSNWAFLEVKKSAAEPHQPNQDYYINLANQCSYGAFIYPENEEEVFNDIQRAFGLKG